MGSFYTQIDKNKRETWLIVLGFVSFISLLFYFISWYTQGDALFLIGIGLIFSGVSSFTSYYHSDKIVLAISRAHEASPEMYKELHNLVENMSIASGLPKPRVYLIEDTAMNAFATGRDPQHGVIVFTTGIVQKLEKRELEGVIAHEMSHIGNYDIRLMSIVSVLVGTVVLVSDMFIRSGFRSSGRGKKGGGGVIVIFALIALILSPIIAEIIKLSVSRNREFLADSTAAMITRYPRGLADALKKLSMDLEPLEAANKATAHMYIVSPLKSANFSKLFNTHPPIEQRIERLMGLESQYGGSTDWETNYGQSN